MSVFRLSNQIFSRDLTASELSVYAYLCSIHAEINILNESVIHVKQTTIAENCCIGSVQTVKKIIDNLIQKGLLRIIERSVKRNGHRGTYYYSVKKMPCNKEYFFVERTIFRQLNTRQMFIYLFLSKSFDNNINDCWNSYSDIAQQTGMKRELVIETINELAEMKFIVRMKRKSKENKKVFIDNHYQIIKYILGHIHKKKARMFSQNIRTNATNKCHNHKKQDYYNSFFRKSQVFSGNFFYVRGSPEIVSH